MDIRKVNYVILGGDNAVNTADVNVACTQRNTWVDFPASFSIAVSGLKGANMVTGHDGVSGQ